MSPKIAPASTSTTTPSTTTTTTTTTTNNKNNNNPTLLRGIGRSNRESDDDENNIQAPSTGQNDNANQKKDKKEKEKKEKETKNRVRILMSQQRHALRTTPTWRTSSTINFKTYRHSTTRRDSAAARLRQPPLVRPLLFLSLSPLPLALTTPKSLVFKKSSASPPATKA